MTKIFVPVFGESVDELKKNIQEAFQHTKYLEFRADLSRKILKEGISFRSLFPAEAIVLFTNRSEEEIECSEFDLINTDIENISEISSQNTMLSYHQYGEFSRSKLKQVIEEMKLHNAKYYKLSVEQETLDDLLSLAKLTKDLPTEKWFLMGMGRMGKVARLLSATLGFGTFASSREHVIASGQIDVAILKQLLE